MSSPRNLIHTIEKPQLLKQSFYELIYFVNCLSIAKEVTIFILQEIIMTISYLNQNNLKTIRETKMESPSERNMKPVHLARESLASAVLKESIQTHQEYSLKLYTQQDSKTATECSPSEIFSPQHINGCGLLQHFKLISLVDTAETLALWQFCSVLRSSRMHLERAALPNVPNVWHVPAMAGSHFSSCIILQYDKFNLKTHVKMPFFPLPKQADLRSVIEFYLEYMTSHRKSQSLGKSKCSDNVVRGLSKSAAPGCCAEPQKTTLFCQWGTGLGEADSCVRLFGSPTWLHNGRIFQCLAPANSGSKKLQHKFVSVLLTATRATSGGVFHHAGK